MVTTTRPKQREEMVRLIRAEAEKVGLPPAVALATAEVEGNFNPNAEGDLKWHERKGGELYRKHVLGSASLAANPARLIPEVWHSYGAFQLLAPYQVEGNEHPHVLKNPLVNAQRGVRMLNRLYKKYDGDVSKVRVHYGAGSLNVSDSVRAQLLSRFMPAYERWSRDDGSDDSDEGPPSGTRGKGMLIALVLGGLFLLSRVKA